MIPLIYYYGSKQIARILFKYGYGIYIPPKFPYV